MPPDLKAGVRVCCFPSKQINSVYTIQISPDSFEDWPYTMREVSQHAKPQNPLGDDHNPGKRDCRLCRACLKDHMPSASLQMMSTALVLQT